jgi:uncharacterized protein (UPF0248 family)
MGFTTFPVRSLQVTLHRVAAVLRYQVPLHRVAAVLQDRIPLHRVAAVLHDPELARLPRGALPYGAFPSTPALRRVTATDTSSPLPSVRAADPSVLPRS